MKLQTNYLNDIRNVVVFMAVVFMGVLTTVRASDDSLRFGVRIGTNVNRYALKGFSWDMMSRGYGFEAGLAAKYPLTDRLSLNSELIFCYRELWVMYDDGIDWPEHDYFYDDDNIYHDIGWYYGQHRFSVSETTVFVPVMVQFTPVISVPFYV